MRQLAIIVLLASACTRPNPDRCCTDEADCTSNDIPVGNTCGSGLTCTGHLCVADECTTPAMCSSTAPYCAIDAGGTCLAACTGNAECPGFGQDSNDTFCVSGGCVACRAGMADCPAATPVCSTAGTCGRCLTNEECASGACAPDGSCVRTTDIAYVDSAGEATGSCSQSEPCSTIEYALTKSAPYVVIAPGTYTRTSALSIVDARTLIGTGSAATQIRRSLTGAVVDVASTGVANLDHLDIGNGAGSGIGYGVTCEAGGSLTIADSTIHDNAESGIMSNCPTTVARTILSLNAGSTINVQAAPFSCDRCTVLGIIGGAGDGIDIDGGPASITNSFIARNGMASGGEGIFFQTTSTGSRIEFNTIVDNFTGIDCELGTGGEVTIQNNIIARNKTATYTPTSNSCVFAHSIIQDDIAGLNFKSPDTAPYDYHLLPGSSAIDQAAASTVDHDFDGDKRPKGPASDIGADEAQ